MIAANPAPQALDVSVLSAMVSAAGMGALLAEAATITALLVLGLTIYTFRALPVVKAGGLRHAMSPQGQQNDGFPGQVCGETGCHYHPLELEASQFEAAVILL